MKRLMLAASLALALSPALAFAAPAPDGHGHDNGRHEGWYKQSYRRGQRVPVVYLQPRYYVNDYGRYGLAPPPRGYRWVQPYQASQEYLLVQVATGLIAQVLGY
jgi:Ni/Co efflux regulator RcnB